MNSCSTWFATCRDCFCLFDTAFARQHSSSGIEVSGNRAQRNYGYACDSLDWKVDLSKQRLIAWTGRKPSYVIVSTGKLSTTHRVLPFNRGIALLECRGLTTARRPTINVLLRLFTEPNHRFGTPVSHGCINVAVDHARWLFNWTSVGTPVVVHD